MADGRGDRVLCSSGFTPRASTECRRFSDGHLAATTIQRGDGNLPRLRELVKSVSAMGTPVDDLNLVSGAYTSRFNSWLYASHFSYEKFSHTQRITDDKRNWQVSWVIKWDDHFMEAIAWARSLREAKEKIAYMFMSQLTVTVQMDTPIESLQGLPVADPGCHTILEVRV